MYRVHIRETTPNTKVESDGSVTFLGYTIVFEDIYESENVDLRPDKVVCGDREVKISRGCHVRVERL